MKSLKKKVKGPSKKRKKQHLPDGFKQTPLSFQVIKRPKPQNPRAISPPAPPEPPGPIAVNGNEKNVALDQKESTGLDRKHIHVKKKEQIPRFYPVNAQDTTEGELALNQAILDLHHDFIQTRQTDLSLEPFCDPEYLTLMIREIDYRWSSRGSEAELLAEEDENTFSGLMRPNIRIFGNDIFGHSILLHAYGFRPYLFIRIPQSVLDLEAFEKYISEHLLSALQRRTEQEKKIALCRTRYICSSDIVSGRSLLHYEADESHFLKIVFKGPNCIRPAREILSNGDILDTCFEVFEADILFPQRFGVDTQTYSGCWIQVPRRKLVELLEPPSSSCAMEYDVRYEHIISRGSEEQWSVLAPCLLLSFDIECQGREKHFPDSKTDPCIQIASVLRFSSTKSTAPSLVPQSLVPRRQEIHVVHMLGSVDQAHKENKEQIVTFYIPYPTEAKLIQGWAEFVTVCSPDAIMGYNSNAFDFRYIRDRMEVLHLQPAFASFGKIRNQASSDDRFQDRWRVTERIRTTSANGAQNVFEVIIPGVVVLDILVLVKDLQLKKLPSYTLLNVTKTFLKQTKEDVHHSEIPHLQTTSPQTRRRLADYAKTDARLPLLLVDELKIWVSYVEMTRVTGTTLNRFLNSGQQMKSMNMILRKTRKSNFFVPWFERSGDEGDEINEKYTGATVVHPTPNLYTNPIATLDFASLYPSIMMAHNLCFSTHLNSKRDIHRLDEKNQGVIETPCKNHFVTKKVRKGLLPEILEDLLSARDKAKNLMKKTHCNTEKEVLNARQLALKRAANSVYGFTGAKKGKLPCEDIAASVCAFGRVMLLKTQTLVQQMCTIENNYRANATVIYGDTDSVMIDFGFEYNSETADPEDKQLTETQLRCKHREMIMKIGKYLATEITKEFEPPIRLEFEKVYHPYFLLAPKRYSGLYFTKPDVHDKLDSKGIEAARTDNCPLIRKIQMQCLEKILLDRDREGVITLLKDCVTKLYQQEIDYSSLIIKKSIRRELGNYKSLPPHIKLAKEMASKDPLDAPKEGDSVYYLIVDEWAKTRVRDRSATVDDVVKYGLIPSADWYIEHQLAKPLNNILQILFQNNETLIQDIWTGKHTLTRKHEHLTTVKARHGIASYCIVRPTCLNRECNASLEDIKQDYGGFCIRCQHLRPKYILTIKDSHQAAKEKWNACRTRCETCKDTSFDKITCANYECDNFFTRNKARNSLMVQEKQLSRLKLDDLF